MKQGPDISHHQADVNLTQADASIEFIFLKATEGASFTDDAFATRWAAAGRLGIPRGAYHFARPAGSWRAQADHFVTVVKAAGWRPTDAWALDMEDAGGVGEAGLIGWADSFGKAVTAALGKRGLFYTYPNFWAVAMGAPAKIPGGMGGWWARYEATPRAPAAFGDPPDVWQHSASFPVPGIGPCDHNKMTDDAFSWIFGTGQEVDDMFSDTDRAMLTKVHQQITGAVGAGQIDYASTIEAILTTNQALVNAGRSQTGALAQAIGKTGDTTIAAVIGYLAAHPATAEMSAEAQDHLAAAVADQIRERGITVDEGPLLDALAMRLGG